MGRLRLACALFTAGLSLVVAAPAARAQTAPAPPFDERYTVTDLGSPPGVPQPYGGLTIKAGAPDRLLIGGAANGADGALYEIGVVRDAAGHITGFAGQATRFADAAYNDGGVTYGPGGVLFLARWPANELGQIKPGSTLTDRVVDVGALGVAGSLSSLAFVPPGLAGAGRLKLASYSGGNWYDAAAVPDGAGTYDIVQVQERPAAQLPGGPEGFVFVAPGSPLFDGPSLLVSEYAAGQVAAYALDAAGDPIVASRRTFLGGLTGAEGASTDPVSGDFLFSTFGGGSRVIVVRGFAVPAPTPTPTPTPTATPASTPTAQPTATPVAQPLPQPIPTPPPLPPPVAGEDVNATPAGTVKVRLPKTNRFMDLRAPSQIPVGSEVDTRGGRVTLVVAAGNGKTATAAFYGGLFKLTQTRGAKPVTTLTLSEPLDCPRKGRAASSARKKTRKLWGDGRGAFRTSGRYSSATVRGTRWLVEDRCDSTLTQVAQGVVAVRDARGRTKIVRAPGRYIARGKR